MAITSRNLQTHFFSGSAYRMANAAENAPEPDPIVDKGFFVWKYIGCPVENVPQGQAKPPSISAILSGIPCLMFWNLNHDGSAP
jgi:hypothetical protein